MASVNRPTDVKVKEADVNRKLQWYGIISAFQNGKVPSNDQIDVAINSFLASKAIATPSKKLSSEGQALVKDIREVVKLAKNLLLSKNEGNLLQDFVWQTTHFDPKQVGTPNAPVDKDAAKQHGDKALEGLRTLGTLLITNGQFRKLLNDFTLLVRDMAGDAAANVASKVKPGEDALAQIDKPAEDNMWHDAPDLSKDKLKNQLKNVYKGDPARDVREVVNAGADAARPDGSSADGQAGADAAKGTASQKLKQNLDPETQDRLKEKREEAKKKSAEYRARAKDYLAKKMPEDRREQIIWRLRKMVLECQQHPDYQQAISTLLDLAEQYGSHGRQLATGGTGTVKEARTGLQQAEADLKTLIERFANGTSSDDLWDSIKTIYEDADKDPQLKNWFKAINQYIRKCLKQQGYIMEQESTEEWNQLYDNGNYLLRDRYKGHTDRVVDEIKFLATQFDEDPLNKHFGHAVQKLFNDLGNDANGKPTFKPHLLKDLTEVILPSTFENVAYIPIPRIEYTDSQLDAVVENLVLESDNFMPNVLEIASDHYFRWGRKNIASKNKQAIDVKVTGIQMDLRDVSYYVKRKQGFPAITDQGVANIMMGGEGFCFRLKLVTADSGDKQHFFRIEKVDVDAKNLKIKLVKSNHKLLFGLFQPIMLKVLRPVIQKVAEKQIKDQFNQFDQIMYQVKKEADRALEDAAENPKDAPNIYSRYASALQKHILQGKKRVEEAQNAASDKKVNMAITQEDSIFPNIKLPGGISSKATEYKELARKGDKWESPVFSVGSASKSTDVPKAPAVTRKPHTTASPKPVSSGFGSSAFASNGGGSSNVYGDNAYGQSKVQTFTTNGAYGTGSDNVVTI